MLRAQFSHFSSLRRPVKAMLYLHWIYSFVGGLTGVFVQIFLYQRFDSLVFNTYGMILYFFGCAIGFSLVGAIASWYRMNMKWGYAYAFFALFSSFLFFIGEVSKLDALIFMFANGIGLVIDWVTLHTFELTETRNHERDYYSSILSAGDQMIDLIAPAIATALFFLSTSIFHLGSFTLLFIVSPLIYLAGLPFFRYIQTYRPEPIDLHDLRHFLGDKRNRHAQVYLLAGSTTFAMSKIVLPIAAIIFLGSETQVGLFNTAFAVLSALVLLVLAKHRHGENRLNFLFVTSLLSAGTMLFIALKFDFATFIIFTLLSVVLRPLGRVSAHVIDLETMETLGREGRDFFPTMIFRDAALGFWRIVGLALFTVATFAIGEGEVAVRLGFILLALATLLTYYGAKLIYRKN